MISGVVALSACIGDECGQAMKNGGAKRRQKTPRRGDASPIGLSKRRPLSPTSLADVGAVCEGNRRRAIVTRRRVA
jgi:hypothetical protein